MQVILNMPVLERLSSLTRGIIKETFEEGLPIEVLGTLHNFQKRNLYLAKAHTPGAHKNMNLNIFTDTDARHRNPIWEPLNPAHTQRWVEDNHKKENLFWLDVSRTLPINNKLVKTLLTNLDD